MAAVMVLSHRVHCQHNHISLFTVFSEVFLYGVIIPVLPFGLEDRINIAHSDGDLQSYSPVLFGVCEIAL